MYSDSSYCRTLNLGKFYLACVEFTVSESSQVIIFMCVLKYSNCNVFLWIEIHRLTGKWTQSVFCLFRSELIQFITSGPAIAMEILRDDAICEWKKLLGPANSGMARTDAPGSLRALFGTDGIRNAAHGPDSFASAARVRCFKNILILFFCKMSYVRVKHFCHCQLRVDLYRWSGSRENLWPVA